MQFQKAGGSNWFLPNLLAIFAGLIHLLSSSARGQIFVANASGGTIGEYDLSGNPIQPSLITGLNVPYGVAAAGGNLFVISGDSSTTGQMGEYTLSGSPVNASLFSGSSLAGAESIVASGTNLFVGDYGNSIAEFTASGTTVSPSLAPGVTGFRDLAISGSDIYATTFSDTVVEYTTSGASVPGFSISGVNAPTGIAVSGSDLFIADGSTVKEFTLSGAPLNSSFITGLGIAQNYLTVAGSDLYIANPASGTVSEYDLSGNPVNKSLITGLNGPVGLAVVVPEPASMGLMFLGAFVVLSRTRPARRRDR
jgi:hypothetical protein